MTTLRFRDNGERLTLVVEKSFKDGWVLGWCPERENNIFVNPLNLEVSSVRGGGADATVTTHRAPMCPSRTEKTPGNTA